MPSDIEESAEQPRPKRPRLNPKPAMTAQTQSHKTLTKPFRSPLMTNTTTPNKQITPTQKDLRKPSTQSAEVTTSSTAVNAATTHPQPSPTRIQHRPSESTGRKSMAHIAEVKVLESQTDSLQQAIRILSSPRDDELTRLTRKWRGVSRAAAEEVFAGMRDKVCRIGGVGAWRERERERVERVNEWEREGQRLGPGNGDSEEDEEDEEEDEEHEEGEEERKMKRLERDKKREERSIRKEELMERSEYDRDVQLEDEKRKAGHRMTGLKASPVNQENDAFTMDMMLRMLNIDLDMIGYDVHEQRWVD